MSPLLPKLQNLNSTSDLHFVYNNQSQIIPYITMLYKLCPNFILIIYANANGWIVLLVRSTHVVILTPGVVSEVMLLSD